MDLSEYRHTETITVARPPEELYAIVTDVARMGELSPVACGGEWETEGGAAPGAWFRGDNAIGEFTWSTRCRVDTAEPGRAFTFVNCGAEGDVELVRWGYRFEAAEDGTTVTETWEVLPDYPEFVRAGAPDMSDDDVKARLDGMAGMARDGMAHTLATLKAIAEG